MRILIVHPGPDFSVADVYEGWAEALKAAGCEVAGYNLNDRLIFYSMALLDTGEKDDEGHPVVRQAMTQEQAWQAAIQGLTHACYTFLAGHHPVNQRVLPDRPDPGDHAAAPAQDRHPAHRVTISGR